MVVVKLYQAIIAKLPCFNGIPALLLRFYLAPIFIIAGFNKLNLSDPDITGFAALFAKADIVAWFGNPEWGLGLPAPELLANLAAWTELLGGSLLIIGLATRLISIPLMFTMVVAMTSVHADNGWFAITPTNPDTSPAKVLNWVGIEGAAKSMQNSIETGKRLDKMRDILDEYGNTDWLYEKGNIVVLNNGIEFAATYFIMLLVLVFIGGGRFTSVDFYLVKYFLPRANK